jgi:hypothetical protein
MIRQSTFAAKCGKVDNLKEARDRNLGGTVMVARAGRLPNG